VNKSHFYQTRNWSQQTKSKPETASQPPLLLYCCSPIHNTLASQSEINRTNKSRLLFLSFVGGDRNNNKKKKKKKKKK